MQIQREKFFALTASLAGFWPNAGFTIDRGGGTANTSDTPATTATNTGTTEGAVTSTGAPTGGATTKAEDDCCLGHAAPGCADDAAETCACDEDRFCCGRENVNRDETCVVT